MNQGARAANDQIDRMHEAQYRDQQIALLTEIRDLLKQLLAGRHAKGQAR